MVPHRGDGLLRIAAKALGIRFLPKTIHGITYTLPIEALSPLYFFLHSRFIENYEGEYYQAVIELVKPGDTVFDVGAFIGLYALGFSAAAGDAGTVTCFEPNPYTLAVLRKTVEANRAHNVILEQKALGSSPGEADLWVRGTASTSSLHGVRILGRGRLEKVPCVVTTLDQYVATSGRVPDVLKIDVEGFEWEVLQGANDTLPKHAVCICCELHPDRLSAQGRSAEMVVDLLRGWGYRVVGEFTRTAGRPYNLILRKD
jgi:FkbM family methyltransferase